jgi:hypothetical protein
MKYKKKLPNCAVPKLKIFVLQKDPIERTKEQHKYQDKVFANPMSHKGFKSRICTEFSKLSKKQRI